MDLPFSSQLTALHEQVNGIEWTAYQSFCAFGGRFGLRTSDARTLTRALDYLPHGWQAVLNGEVDVLFSLHLTDRADQSSANLHHFLYLGQELLARETEDTVLLSAFASHAQLMTAQHAKEFLFVHAGVVTYEGRAILIPGHSWSGKSSLVRALVRAGATYFSDEFAVLDERGWVHPYALPLSERGGDGRTTRIPVEQLGSSRAAGPAPVGLIVMTKYHPHAKWRPQALTPAQALLALMANTVAAQHAPQLAMRVLRETVLQSQIVQTGRGDARRIAPRLFNLLQDLSPLSPQPD